MITMTKRNARGEVLDLEVVDDDRRHVMQSYAVLTIGVRDADGEGEQRITFTFESKTEFEAWHRTIGANL